MIPSDHFVRFYNEIFKYLDSLGGSHLNDYYLEISRTQEIFCLDLFRSKGLQGMYEYWDRIRIEENCDMTLTLHDGCLELQMKKCPSLSKVIDNDATPCLKYCDHCFGWIAPLLKKAGFYCVKDLHERTEPSCTLYIFKKKAEAKRLYEKLKVKSKNILSNCDS